MEANQPREPWTRDHWFQSLGCLGQAASFAVAVAALVVALLGGGAVADIGAILLAIVGVLGVAGFIVGGAVSVLATRRLLVKASRREFATDAREAALAPLERLWPSVSAAVNNGGFTRTALLLEETIASPNGISLHVQLQDSLRWTRLTIRGASIDAFRLNGLPPASGQAHPLVVDPEALAKGIEGSCTAHAVVALTLNEWVAIRDSGHVTVKFQVTGEWREPRTDVLPTGDEDAQGNLIMEQRPVYTFAFGIIEAIVLVKATA